MLIKQITIKGMRGMESQTFNFSKGVNYILGKNGAGKSTIIDAIYLGLFGYIPNTPKKLANIMMNANSSIMSIMLELDDQGCSISIVRTWVRKRTSVEQTVVVNPESIDVKKLTESASLPIFNFNEFSSKSANDQKLYFTTNILTAQSDDETNLTKLISSKFEDEKLESKYMEDLKGEILKTIEGLPKSATPFSNCVRLNQYFKELQSLKKMQITEAEKTLATLVKTDDSELSRSSQDVQAEIDQVDKEMTAYNIYLNEKQQLDKWAASAGTLLGKIDSFDESENIQESAEYIALMQAREAYTKFKNESGNQIEASREEVQRCREAIAEYRTQCQDRDDIIRSNGVCTYTKKQCPDIVKLIDHLKVESAEANKKIDELNQICRIRNAEIAKINVEESKQLTQLDAAQEAYDAKSKEYTRLKALKSSKPTVQEYTGASFEILNDRKTQLRAELSKIEQKAAYDKLHDKAEADKAKYEMELQLIKQLVTYTGANGLQTELMEKPFRDFEDKMTIHLQELFHDPEVHAKFYLSSAASSFSFGVEHRKLSAGTSYKPYQVLSSGEKCTFFLAFAITIMQMIQSASTIDCLLVDDILDHLDKDMTKHLFEKLAGTDFGLQIISAGVIPCTIKGINKIKLVS